MAAVIAHVLISLAVFAALLITAFCLIASGPPQNPSAKDIFGFASGPSKSDDGDRPDLQRYAARDGEEIAFRFYESTSERILIFAHGSSAHGGGYHKLASFVSSQGAAKVILPNLRGHYMSGRRRGDVDYIGQLEDDLADLIQWLRSRDFSGPITLGGHSSGGGLAVRFAGGSHAKFVSSYLLLSPVIPTSSAIKDGNSGGWTNLHRRRLYGLIFLNALGMHGYDGLSIIEFNKPVKFWDGTETLSYSWRLNSSYHPRYKYNKDIDALPDRTMIIIGEKDQALNPAEIRKIFLNNQVSVLAGIDHFGIFREHMALEAITEWLCASAYDLTKLSTH